MGGPVPEGLLEPVDDLTGTIGGKSIETDGGPGLFGIEDEPPVTGEPSSEAPNQAIRQVFEALPVRRADAMEPRPAVLPGLGPIEQLEANRHERND